MRCSGATGPTATCRPSLSLRGNAYFGFHDGFNGDTTLRLLAADAGNGAITPFAPQSAGSVGVLGLSSDGPYLAAVGKFPKMGGVSVKNVAVFVCSPPSCNAVTRRLTTASTPSAIWRGRSPAPFRSFMSALATAECRIRGHERDWSSGGPLARAPDRRGPRDDPILAVV